MALNKLVHDLLKANKIYRYNGMANNNSEDKSYTGYKMIDKALTDMADKEKLLLHNKTSSAQGFTDQLIHFHVSVQSAVK